MTSSWRCFMLLWFKNTKVVKLNIGYHLSKFQISWLSGSNFMEGGGTSPPVLQRDKKPSTYYGTKTLVRYIQVILAGTLTGVHGNIRCKVLAALSAVKYLIVTWAGTHLIEGCNWRKLVLVIYLLNEVHIDEVSKVCNRIKFGRHCKDENTMI